MKQGTVVTPDQKSVIPEMMAVTPKTGKPVTTKKMFSSICGN
jgi:hypothetical protein